MAEVKTYSANQLAIVCGNHIVTGYADDSFVTIEPNGESVTSVVGCDGEVGRAVNPDKTCKVKLSLMQTSASNKFFTQMWNRDRKDGTGVFPLLIKDLSGELVCSADSAWVVTAPTRTYGKNLNNREIQLATGACEITE